MRASLSFYGAAVALLFNVHNVVGAPTNSTPTGASGGLISATVPSSEYPPPTVSIGAAGGPIASVSGRMFSIESKVQYFSGNSISEGGLTRLVTFLGANAWWLGYLQSNTDVDNVLSDFASVSRHLGRQGNLKSDLFQTQFKVARVWAFASTTDPASASESVYYQLLNTTGQYFNFDSNTGKRRFRVWYSTADSWTGIPRLDYVVSAAEQKGVKLVLPLVNNYDGAGGISDYTTAFGCSHTAFYTDATCQAAYKNYIRFIVERYKSSAAVFAWELCNEPRCSGCSSSIITNWATDISAYIKSLDSSHMVTLGDEGWLTPPSGDGSYAYSGYEGVDFTANLKIPNIDYGTFHAYPDQWGYNDSWVNEWIQQHDAIGQTVGKPVVLEEYGSTSANGQKQTVMSPWQQTVLSKTSVACDLFWQFGIPLSINPYDNYVIMYDTSDGSDYQVLGNQHAAAMLGKQPAANQSAKFRRRETVMVL